MKKSIVSIVFLSLMLVFFSGPALASYATATAEFNWSLLSYSGNVLIAPTSIDVETAATAGFVQNTIPEVPVITYGPDGQGGSGSGAWYKNYGTTATISDASAIAVASALKLSSASTAGPTGVYSPESSASSSKYATFIVKADGTVFFQLPYTLAYDMAASAGMSSEAEGWARIRMYLTRDAGNEAQTAELISDLVFDTWMSNQTKSELGYVQMLGFKKGETGTITFETETYARATAPVPIPAAFWLLGTGLVGLVGIRRKTGK